MGALMSPARAEKWLGMKPSNQGKALLRAALRRERETGKRFVVRQGSGSGQRYLFSRVALRRHMPELLEGRYEGMARRIEQTLQRVKDHIDDIIDERIEQHPAITTLQAQQVETIEHVLSLAEQVERISGLRGTPQNSAT